MYVYRLVLVVKSGWLYQREFTVYVYRLVIIVNSRVVISERVNCVCI